jgi:hypothetical protein
MGTQIQLKSKELDGTDYVYVYADGNPVQNGEELRSAVATAYADFSVTNRMQTVLMGPGTYDMNFDPLKLTDAIRLEGLTNDRGDVSIKSLTAPNQPGMIFDLPNFEFNNAFNESLKTLLLQNFYFNSVFSSTADYIYGVNNFQLARISTADGTYITAPIPSGFNSGTVYADKVSGDVFFYSYNSSLGTWAIAKLNSSLAVDTSFAIVTVNSSPKQILKDINTGGYFMCGNFTVVNGFSRQRITKFNSDGTLDLTFNVGTGINSDAQSMVHLPMTNELIVGGFFDNYNGNTVQYVAVLDGTTAAYSALAGQTTGFDGPIQSVYNDLINGQLIFSGYFNNYNGIPFNKAVKTNYAGGSPSQLFLSQIAYEARMYSNYVVKENYVYVLFSNTTYNGTNYVTGTVLKINLSDGLVVDTYNLTPTSISFADQRFFIFNDINNTEYLFIPYYVNAGQFPAIDVDTPIPYISVYINNLSINGILLNDTRLTASNIYADTYMDRDYYNGSLYPGWGYGFVMENSTIGNLKISGGDLQINKSSRANNGEINPFLMSSSYLGVSIRDSYANNLFNNSKRIDFGQCEIRNSEVTYSFNNFLSTPRTSANGFEGNNLYSATVDKSIITSCFQSTLIPQLNVKDSYIENSFQVNGNASTNEDQLYISWNISGCNGNYSFIFNTGKTNPNFPDSISNLVIRDCNITQGAFYFKTIIRSTPSVVSFSDVHVSDVNSSSLSLYLTTFDKIQPWENQEYNWYQGVVFENCSVTTRQQFNQNTDMLSITIDEKNTTGGTVAELMLQNFSFNNCKVRGNGSFRNTLNINVLGNKRGILMSNINYTDCSVSNRTEGANTNGSFIKGIETFGNLNMNNIQFDNCSVFNGGPGFISNITTNGQYFYTNSILFRDCESNRFYNFISNVITGTLNTSAVYFFDCRSSDYSFLTNISVSNWEQSGYIDFENCEAGSDSFVCQSPFPYTPVYPSFRFINCIAGNQSFVKSFLSPVFAYFNFCKAGDSSYGNNYFNPSAGVLEMTVVGGAQHCSAGYGSFGTYAGPIYGGPGYFSFNEAQGSFSAITGVGGLYNN